MEGSYITLQNFYMLTYMLAVLHVWWLFPSDIKNEKGRESKVNLGLESFFMRSLPQYWKIYFPSLWTTCLQLENMAIVSYIVDLSLIHI